MKSTSLFLLFISTYVGTSTWTVAQSSLSNKSYLIHPQIIEADSLMLIHQWDQSIFHYGKARSDFESQKNWPGYFYATIKIGASFQGFNLLDDAIGYYNQALDEGVKLLGENHLEMARCHYHLASYYIKNPVRDLPRSLVEISKAIEMQEAMLPAMHLDLADSYRMFGVYHYYNESYVLSKASYQKALEIYEELLDPLDIRLARAYNSYSFTLRADHDIDRCQAYRIKAAQIFDVHPEGPRLERTQNDNNIGNTFYVRQQFKESIPFYEKAIVGHVDQYGRLTSQGAETMGNMASAYGAIGETDIACKYFHRAIKQTQSSQNRDSIRSANIYHLMGDMYLKTNHLDSAKIYIELALDYNNASAKTHDHFSSDLFSRLSDYYLKVGDFENSQHYIQKSLVYLLKDFKCMEVHCNPDINANSYSNELYYVLAKKAKILFQYYKHFGNISYLKNAYTIYKDVNRLADDLRNQPYSEQVKLKLAGSYKSIASTVVELAIELLKIDHEEEYKNLAFSYTEKTRYAKIYDNLKRAERFQKSSKLDSLLLVERTISSEIENLKTIYSSSTDSVEQISLQNHLFDMEIEFDKFQYQIEKDHPNYFNVNYNEMFQLHEVQSKLEDHTQILQYLWADSVFYVFNISRNNVSLDISPVPSLLSESIEWFTRRLSKRTNLNAGEEVDERYATYAEVSHLLYRELLEPFLQQEREHIIISADGPLATLPFECLLTDDQISAWRHAPYLIRDYSIQYAYSSNLLLSTPEKNTSAPTSILAYAYSDAATSSSTNKNLSYNGIRDHLSEIIGSSFEVDAIKEIFNLDSSQVLKAGQATEASFKRNAEDYSVVHLSIHGEGSTEDELKSSLFFNDVAESKEDGQLFAHELYGLDLRNMQLAVLSACESGIGKDIKGEGVFSMARGFAYAGCPSSVVSLWNINDRSTADLMEYFYQGLSTGQRLDQSLREAKLKFINEAKEDKLADPFYWASFVLLGDGSPVFQSNGLTSFWTLVLASTVLFFTIFFFKKYA